MTAHSLGLSVAGWLLTYLVHSTLLVGAAVLLSKVARGVSWQDTLWKVALVGGLFTATIQSATGLRPSLGRFHFPLAVPAAESQAPAPSIESDRTTLAEAQPTARIRGDSEAAPRSELGKMSVLLLLWLAVATVMLVRLAGRQIRLRRMLADRQHIVIPSVAAMLTELRRNAGIWRPVWLSSSSRCSTPLAFGASEICVPDRFIHDLAPDEQRAALAHELAHLQRRDPLWHFVISIIEAVMFFQPLNRLARIRLREAAEYLCDDWAVRQVGSETGLARCLAAVAGWVAPERELIPAGTMAIAEGGSPLLERVRRLLERRSASATPPAVARAFAATALIAVTVAAAPVIGKDREIESARSVAELQSSPVMAQDPRPDMTSIATDLERSAIDDPDAGVRRAAAEAMGNLPPVLAVRVLTRTIWESRDEHLQVEATEALGEVGDAGALVALESIAWRHPSKKAALKAVEAIAEIDTSRAVFTLRTIARAHPDNRMRREALEELGDMGLTLNNNFNRGKR